ncbi:ATPase [Devosia rhodophyticola]|uniref:ATPase n=1 Tax=Devosia rhodophyticola TaxID=3026423 RepID=A0ABY7YXG1_9HYPH|nr:ATP12 family protein [Devosia rhodophyticola]WDR05941.1 ATPase [Devosia rhodophyticola]
MRDQLEEAGKHRDDGYGRAQHHVKTQLPKRFYSQTGVSPVDGGFSVTLDGRATRTPALKLPVVVPHADIAMHMADEWAAQGELIDPAKMPMVRLINSALESGEALVPAFRDEVVKFAGNDLLLYRADYPSELVAEQETHWDAALVKVARHFGVSFQPTVGVMHQDQPPPTLARLAEVLQHENLLVMTALVSITGISGSGILAIGLWHKLFTPDELWTAAHVDEDFQNRQWGIDEEAAERRRMRRLEFDTAVKVLDALRN